MGIGKNQRSGENRIEELEMIVAEHETALLRYATRLVNDPHTAQDVVQKTFIKLFEKWRDKGYPEMKNIRSANEAGTVRARASTKSAMYSV